MSTMSNEEVSPAAVPSPATPAGPPPEGPWLRKMREIMGLLADPIDERMGKLELHLAGFTADDVAKDILQLQRRLLWQAADLWCLLANERAAIGDAEGADESRWQRRALMHHYGEELSADAPSDALERLNRLQVARTRPLDIEQLINSFAYASAEDDEKARELLREYGRAFGEHARPVIERIAEASVRRGADAVRKAVLLKEAHVMLEAVSIEMAYPVAQMWCDLGYICKDLGDIDTAVGFADNAFLIPSGRPSAIKAKCFALVEARDAYLQTDPEHGEADEEVGGGPSDLSSPAASAHR